MKTLGRAVRYAPFGQEGFVLDEVIAAIITPPGIGAIGAVRVSGLDSWRVAAQVLRNRRGDAPTARDRYMRLARAVHPRTGALIDEVLFVFMRGPRSYTGEDVVEIYCHGGHVVVRLLLDAVFAAGCRPADPGEFSRRAFLNGRMDLSQAEAVIDLIEARTGRGAEVALQQLGGRLGRAVGSVEEELLLAVAALEAWLDFPEDDIERTELERLSGQVAGWLETLTAMLEGSKAGSLLREGITAAIVGPPNVGKSSLLNAVARQSRAIVTEYPGTTRDAIEEWVDVLGIPVRLVDTAGIRETDDPVERLGVERSREYLERADVVLFMVDAAAGAEGVDRVLYNRLEGKPAVVVLNKIDLPERVTPAEARSLFPERPVVRMSLKDGSGLEELERELVSLVHGGAMPPVDCVMISSDRHRQAVRDAVAALEQARTGLEQHCEVDLIVADLRSALRALGRITGRSVEESVLETIFSRFCVGK